MTHDNSNQKLSKPNVKDAPKQRPCLRCSEIFESTGIGERICRRCKGSNAWRNGIPATPGSSNRR